MISSKITLGFGIIAAIGMLPWGLSGVFIGRIATKSYDTIDGKRMYYRFVRRGQEPIWFWIVCSVYMAVGIALMVIIYVLFHQPVRGLR